MNPFYQGFLHIFKAAGYSLQGLKHAWKKEIAFRQECIIALILIPIALFLDISNPEKVLLIIPIFIVLIVELINSAIEVTINRIGTERRELSGQAKDLAATAVFFSLILVVVTWSFVLLTAYG